MSDEGSGHCQRGSIAECQTFSRPDQKNGSVRVSPAPEGKVCRSEQFITVDRLTRDDID